MELRELHDLAETGIEIYARTRDPLTRSAVRILLTTNQLPLNGAQEAAAELLRRQYEAYKTLYIESLHEQR